MEDSASHAPRVAPSIPPPEYALPAQNAPAPVQVSGSDLDLLSQALLQQLQLRASAAPTLDEALARVVATNSEAAEKATTNYNKVLIKHNSPTGSCTAASVRYKTEINGIDDVQGMRAPTGQDVMVRGQHNEVTIERNDGKLNVESVSSTFTVNGSAESDDVEFAGVMVPRDMLALIPPCIKNMSDSPFKTKEVQDQIKNFEAQKERAAQYAASTKSAEVPKHEAGVSA